MKRRVPRPAEVFLSHATPNRRAAARIARILRRHRIPTWFSRTHIVGSKDWHDAIGEALDRCDWFVVLVSPASVKSEWVKRELLFALRERRYRDRIVPILYQPCKVTKLSWTLGGVQMVDFTSNFERGCRDLLRIWGIAYKK